MDASGMGGNKTVPAKTIGWLWGFLIGFVTASIIFIYRHGLS